MATLLTEDTVDEAARTADDLAQKLRHVEADLETRGHRLVWRGSAADHYAATTKPLHAALLHRSEELIEVGRLLRAAADKLRLERAELTRVENHVMSVLRSKPDPAGYLRSVGWTEHALPPAGDTAWARVAKLMAAKTPRSASSGGAPL